MRKKNYSWNNKKVFVKKTNCGGLGLFCRKDLVKNELILVMGGYVFDIKDENNLNIYNEDKPIEISQDFSFSPISRSDGLRMIQHSINHSCEPNSGWKGQLFLVAMKKIKEGEEITFDYATIMHSNVKSKTYFKMKCLCGHKNCRKIITEDDWKISELQKKYDGYFQWFLQEKINCIKNGKKYKKPYSLPDDFYK